MTVRGLCAIAQDRVEFVRLHLMRVLTELTVLQTRVSRANPATSILVPPSPPPGSNQPPNAYSSSTTPLPQILPPPCLAAWCHPLGSTIPQRTPRVPRSPTRLRVACTIPQRT